MITYCYSLLDRIYINLYVRCTRENLHLQFLLKHISVCGKIDHSKNFGH